MILIVYRICFVLTLLFGFNNSSTAQNHITRTFNSEYYDKDSLMKLYGNNKLLLAGYEQQILLALAYYPELVDVEISFRFDNMKTSGKTRPTIASMFRDDNKHFIISINLGKNRYQITID